MLATYSLALFEYLIITIQNPAKGTQKWLIKKRTVTNSYPFRSIKSIPTKTSHLFIFFAKYRVRARNPMSLCARN